MAGTTPESAVLSGTFTPSYTGEYNLNIRNYRPYASSSLLHNYIDNISIVPVGYTLGADGVTFSCTAQTTRNFEIKAGPAHGDQYYWLWMGYSGTFPGTQVGPVTVPLNYDALVSLCLKKPGIGGTGFIGQLDANGKATATMTVPPVLSLMGLTLHFAYVVHTPGGVPLMASNHVNGTFTLEE